MNTDLPLVMSTDEVAVQILRCRRTRQDKRAAAVRRAVANGDLPEPITPMTERIDTWRFSVPQILARLGVQS